MPKPHLCAIFLLAICGLAGCYRPGWPHGLEPVPKAVMVATDPTARLVFVGDIMLDRRPGAAVAKGEDPFAAFGPVLTGADLAVGNLECVIATRGPRIPKPYNFRCHPRNVPLLARYFGAVSVANNHTGDSGPEGVAEMLGLLRSGWLPYAGAGRNAPEAHTPLIVERNGLRIALLAYNEVELRSYEAGAHTPGLAWSVDGEVTIDIMAAKASADLVVVYPHWGLDYERQPSERQRLLARRMIDAGASLVVGAHPHVTESIEAYKGGLIVYSLGNFVFDDFLDVPPHLNEPSRTSWVLRATVGRAGVVAWDTLVARTDDTGFPRRVPGVQSPCGKAGSKEIALCTAD
jgi:poly-gamma-glutamate capsule biosynthesis protein CapA/YwtB (metallophosphatase superfamily)